jgi:hypothetical protein
MIGGDDDTALTHFGACLRQEYRTTLQQQTSSILELSHNRWHEHQRLVMQQSIGIPGLIGYDRLGMIVGTNMCTALDASVLLPIALCKSRILQVKRYSSHREAVDDVSLSQVPVC